jgi:hypothetical protein
MIGNPGFYRRSHAQAPVHPAKVVKSEMKRDGMLEVLQLLAESRR